jgi:predicted nucleic acid-binding protein
VILADTSVWIDHFRNDNALLRHRLEEGVVATHDFVRGELACGGLRQRREVLHWIAKLPHAPLASTNEVLHLIEARTLMSRGIGWTDAHLLASVLLADVAVASMQF